jgi:uncharacterized membrane protein YqjE
MENETSLATLILLSVLAVIKCLSKIKKSRCSSKDGLQIEMSSDSQLQNKTVPPEV